MIEEIKSVINTVNTAADMMCAEASNDFRECNAVMQVALNRVDKFNQPLIKILTAPHQFSLKCPPEWKRITHYLLAIKAIQDKQMNVPKWLTKDTLLFCTSRAAEKHNWFKKYKKVGKLRHFFFKKIQGVPQA